MMNMILTNAQYKLNNMIWFTIRDGTAIILK